MKVLAWLLGTATGRGVLIGGSITLGMALGWWAFSSHYYDKGKAECEAARAVDTNAANVAQGEKNVAANKTSSGISAAADAAARGVIHDANTDDQDAKETINETYKKPPVTAPVSIGACVHPVDDRVQDRIKAARAAAAGA